MLQETNINKFIGCIEQSGEILIALLYERIIFETDNSFSINTALWDFSDVFDNDGNSTPNERLDSIKSIITHTEKPLISTLDKEVRDNLYNLNVAYQMPYLFDLCSKIPLHLFFLEKPSTNNNLVESFGILYEADLKITGDPYGVKIVSYFEGLRSKSYNVLHEIEAYFKSVVHLLDSFTGIITKYSALFTINTESLNAMLGYSVFYSSKQAKRKKLNFTLKVDLSKLYSELTKNDYISNSLNESDFIDIMNYGEKNGIRIRWIKKNSRAKGHLNKKAFIDLLRLLQTPETEITDKGLLAALFEESEQKGFQLNNITDNKPGAKDVSEYRTDLEKIVQRASENRDT